MTSINDLGVFDQAVWGILHKKPFLNTIIFNKPINWLGFHFHPILAIFSIFYLISPTVNWFIAAQALALSIAAWPLFLLAKTVWQSEKAGFLWALCYLVNPILLNSAAWDFHPISLAVPFIATALLAIEMKNFRILLFSSLVILLCKEHLGLMIVGFGLIWWIKHRYWRTSLILIILGILHFLLVFEVIMPELSPTNSHLMLSDGSSHLSRYSWIGKSFKEMLYTLIARPVFVIKTALLDFSGWKYLILLFFIFLGAPLLAPQFLLAAAPDLLANLLSSISMPRSIFAYHSVSLIPVFTIAAIYGGKRIKLKVICQTKIRMAALVFAVNFICGYIYAPLPLPGAFNFWSPSYYVNWKDPQLAAISSAVGKNSVISVQNNVGAHFSQRGIIYLFPSKIGEADFIILRLGSPTNNVNNIPENYRIYRKGLIGTLDSHLQMDRTEYIEVIEKLLAGKQYGIFIWNDPWLVLRKGAGRKDLEREIKSKLIQIKKEWRVDYYPKINFKSIE